MAVELQAGRQVRGLLQQFMEGMMVVLTRAVAVGMKKSGQILFYFYLFIFGCVRSSLLCVGFLQLWRAGATLRCSARASHCGGFSCCGARTLGRRASVVVECGLSSCGLRSLERMLSSCGSRAQLLRGLWDLPQPGLEPMSPALAGGFLTTAPPGKQWTDFRFRGRLVVE